MSGGRALVVCRRCGERGDEDADDPCPGLCPACFEDALLGTLAVSVEERWVRGLTARTCLANQLERLRAIGVTRACERRYLRRAEEILADDLAAERRGN